MNHKLLTFLMALTLCSLVTGLAAASEPPMSGAKRLLVKIEMSEFKTHYAEIHSAGLDVAGMNIPHGKVDLIVTPNEFELLRRMGVSISHAPLEVSQASPDPKFKTPDQLAQILAQYQRSYPDLAQVSSIGKSLQGRDILALKITQHVSDSITGKPSILFNGMHHAREVMSTEVPLDIADYLLTNYGKNANVTHWVNSDVIYVIPMLNVDGNNIVWTEDNMWRKNARGGFGVDINRNYPYQWNSCNGSSGSTADEDYRGPSAASEPETNVLMDYVRTIHPALDISFHSYSELVIYPYGCGGHTETADVIEPLGKQMAALIPSDSGSGTYTAGLAPDLLYPVDGADIDWMYHEMHVIPYVIELNSDALGFQPSFDDWRDKTVSSLRPAWQLLLNRLDQSSIYGEIKSRSSSGRQYTQVAAKLTTPGGTSLVAEIYPIHHDGSFHLIVNQGNYRLSFSGPGLRPVDQLVHVDHARVNLSLDLPN
jgi:carboxypeptidase T